MSKRVQRYACDDCGAVWGSAEEADWCEKRDSDSRMHEAQAKLTQEISEELWVLSLAQLAEVLNLVKKMQAATKRPTPDPQP